MPDSELLLDELAAALDEVLGAVVAVRVGRLVGVCVDEELLDSLLVEELVELDALLLLGVDGAGSSVSLLVGELEVSVLSLAEFSAPQPLSTKAATARPAAVVVTREVDRINMSFAGRLCRWARRTTGQPKSSW